MAGVTGIGTLYLIAKIIPIDFNYCILERNAISLNTCFQQSSKQNSYYSYQYKFTNDTNNKGIYSKHYTNYNCDTNDANQRQYQINNIAQFGCSDVNTDCSSEIPFLSTYTSNEYTIIEKENLDTGIKEEKALIINKCIPYSSENTNTSYYIQCDNDSKLLQTWQFDGNVCTKLSSINTYSMNQWYEYRSTSLMSIDYQHKSTPPTATLTTNSSSINPSPNPSNNSSAPPTISPVTFPSTQLNILLILVKNHPAYTVVIISLIISLLNMVFIVILSEPTQCVSIFRGLSGTQVPLIPIYNQLITDRITGTELIHSDSNSIISIPNISNIVETIKTILSSYDEKDYYLCKSLSFYFANEKNTQWSCGYTNMQTLSSSLLRFNNGKNIYLDYLFDGMMQVPHICQLKKFIDKAHKLGFDPEGMRELGLIEGTNKWIGGVDVTAAFRSYGVPASIFRFKTETNKQRNEFFLWIKDYFQQRDELNSNFVPPLYCQREGHSTTIIGTLYDQMTGDWKLIVLDPVFHPYEIRKLRHAKKLMDIKMLLNSKEDIKKMLLKANCKSLEIITVPMYGVMDANDKERCKQVHILNVT